MRVFLVNVICRRYKLLAESLETAAVKCESTGMSDVITLEQWEAATEDLSPTYEIKQVKEHLWVLLKRRPDAEFGFVYDYPFPVAQHLCTEAEAIAWMKADISGGMPDRDAMEPLSEWRPPACYDKNGNQMKRPKA